MIGAVPVALFCEWVIARLAPGSAFVPPAATFAGVLVMQALPFSVGLWYGLAAGFLLDSVALPPFGATMLLFLFLACAMGIARLVIADRMSPLAKAAVVAGLFALAYAVAPLARAAAALLSLEKSL